MDRTRWQQLSELLDEALALAPAERGPWLAALTARDAELGAQLERMLKQADAEMTEPVGPEFEQWLGQALNQTQTISFTAPPMAGQRCGAWELTRKIGEGGMGQVWLARRADGLYEAQAAIKLLRTDVPATALAGRFAREREVLARLNHPAIARLLDAGIEGGRAFLVLEHVNGHSLAEHMRDHCPTVADRVRLVIRIAEGVEHAHAQLIVHRDLKPSNVLVTPAGEPKLLDFGIAGVLDAEGQAGDAQLTRQMGRLMTPAYASPEQVKGEPIGTATDVFSLCVMLFELLSGELPFAPRDTDRMALEHALLHKEAKRLTQTRPGAARGGDDAGVAIPPPTDFQRVRGDLEAVVAKGLRKQPAERYGSVRALILDLERWLSHRPVSVRRDDWRHRAGLWLRRNALVAAAGGGVTLALLAGLAATSWQWRRAEAAARQSDSVTRYLGDLLASASPERHGGNWPNVLQLLEISRKELDQRFQDEPDVLVRLQGVLGNTYTTLNRPDIATPIAERRLALARQRYGPDDRRTIEATLDLGQTYSRLAAFDKAIPLLEPLLKLVPQHYGPQSIEHASFLKVLSYCYSRTGRMAESEQLMLKVGPILEARFPPGDPNRVMHLNSMHTLRVQQGRYREALAYLSQTEPYWHTMPSWAVGEVLMLRRNMISLQIRLADHAQLERRGEQVVRDADKLYGRGSEMAEGMRALMARYYTEIGQFEKARQQRDENVAVASTDGVRSPAVLLPTRALALPARALVQPEARDALLREGRAVLREMDDAVQQIGYRRGEAWLALARLGLNLEDAEFAAAALKRLHDDKALKLDADKPLGTRVAQLDGELARLRGDLKGSAALLRQRTQYFEGFTDPVTPPAWSAQLDLAYTLVLAKDPAAGAALARAAQLRPPGMPTGGPQDALQAYLLALLLHGREDAPGVLAAQQALDKAMGRSASAGPPPRATLGGVFL